MLCDINIKPIRQYNNERHKRQQEITNMNECFEYIKTNINALLGIVGALLTGLFLLILYRKNKTREYRKQLFDAISPELNRILQTNDDCGIILTDTAYSKHETAVNNLMAHLDFFERFCLTRRWTRLAMMKIDKDTYIPAYSQYSDSGSSIVRDQVRPLVIKRLHAVLSFGKK
jgi:hypothetical protein